MNHRSSPINIAQLESRLASAAQDLDIPVARARVMLCTLIVSQMLPSAVVIKGGMGVKLRFGEHGTRATADFDVSAESRGEEFEQRFHANLAEGWGTVPPSKKERRRDPHAPNRVAFTASLRAKKPYDPGLANSEYVMHPYRVTISFLGKEWGGLDVELSDAEIAPEAHTSHEIDKELVEFGDYFGFDELQPVPMIDLEYQIAQKLHAVTDPSYMRAHDMVDLQILFTGQVDFGYLRELCVRTFGWRRQQTWPPLPLRPMDNWESAYSDAREETETNGMTNVLPDIEQARIWLTEIVARISDDPGKNLLS